MQTKLTELLGIRYPIIQGAMAWVSDAKLAAAVANAGGTGVIATGGRDTDYVRQQIILAKQLTTKPFGVNVMLMAPNRDEVVETICREGVAFVTLGAGNPVPYFDAFDRAGVKKVPVIPNLKLAKRVEAAGADAIIIEGMEAGGHIGTLTTMALLTQVIPAINIPVIAAGGFADGRGLAAALLMGAAGVQMGTRFLVAQECGVHQNFKDKLLQATDTDSIITGLRDQHAVRGLKNTFSKKFLEMEREGVSAEELIRFATGTNRLAAVEGDVENGFMQAGQSLLPLQKIQPVKDIIEEIMQDTVATLKSARDLLGAG
mgnify:CR=1 FL=1